MNPQSETVPVTASPHAWLPVQPLILASGSTARARMLQDAGIRAEKIPANVDERAIEAAMASQSAEPVAMALAKAKAQAVSALHPGRWVLGADQTLDHAGCLLHKSPDIEAARQQLLMLAGQTHALTSAAVLMRDGSVVAQCASTARLTMRPLSEATVSTYLAMAGPAALETVGGYQLEAFGVHLFDKIEGDHFTILGLPLLALLAGMRRLGLVAP